jgi:hypothetical protein
MVQGALPFAGTQRRHVSGMVGVAPAMQLHDAAPWAGPRAVSDVSSGVLQAAVHQGYAAAVHATQCLQ